MSARIFEPATGGSDPHHNLARGAVTIAYRHTPAAKPRDRAPGVMFLPGYMSDMTGSKAVALETWATGRGLAFTRFDYQGHGRSSGRFEEGTIGLWAEDALAVLDHVTRGPHILVGSSMGAWIMLLVARQRPERLAGLVGVATAADFTEDLIWNRLDAATRATLVAEGRWFRPSPYPAPEPKPVTMALIDEARQHLVLRSPLAITCPVRLLHGMRDEDVPWSTSQRLVEALSGDDVHLTLIKDGDHRLSRDQDLALIRRRVDDLVGSMG